MNKPTKTQRVLLAAIADGFVVTRSSRFGGDIYWSLPKGTTGATVDQCESRGHIERAKDPSDLRRSTYTLTPAGARAAAAYPPTAPKTVTLYAVGADGALESAEAIEKPSTYKFLEYAVGFGGHTGASIPKDQAHTSPRAALEAAYARAESDSERAARASFAAESRLREIADALEHLD